MFREHFKEENKICYKHDENVTSFKRGEWKDSTTERSMSR